MAHPVPRRFVEYVLLGPLDDRRQLQNSPLLGDVWIAYAERPGTPRQLLIAPHKDCGAGSVAVAINDLVEDEDAQVAYLQGIVAACLKFEDVLAIVVPMTEWWARPSNTQALETYLRKRSGETRLANTISGLNAAWISGAERPAAGAVDRYVALAAILLWAKSAGTLGGTSGVGTGKRVQTGASRRRSEVDRGRFALRAQESARPKGQTNGLAGLAQS